MSKRRAYTRTFARGDTIHVADGSPYYVGNLREWYDQCCDCGLVHRVRYQIEDEDGDEIDEARLRIWAWRMPQMTREERKNIEVSFAMMRERKKRKRAKK